MDQSDASSAGIFPRARMLSPRGGGGSSGCAGRGATETANLRDPSDFAEVHSHIISENMIGNDRTRGCALEVIVFPSLDILNAPFATPVRQVRRHGLSRPLARHLARPLSGHLPDTSPYVWTSSVGGN
eukprot:1176540-Prorocentrum_minimum.AAC.8